ncbi:MAG: hypothetical protein WCK39_00660, partial [Methanomassiliicoccales archaeon]
ITGYRVYRSTTESGTYTLIVSLSGTTYTDTGLTDGQAYWYKVSAVNAKGEGDRCYATSATSTVSSMTWLLALAVGIVIAIVLVVLIMRSSKKKGNFPGQKPPSYQYPPTSYPNRQMPPSPAQVQPIVYCNNCGAPLAGGAFCQKCGRQVK